MSSSNLPPAASSANRSPKTSANATSASLSHHDYAAPMDTSKINTKRSLTPTKTLPSSRKFKVDNEKEEIPNAVILSAINDLQSLMKDFGSQLQQNTAMIASVAKAVEFNSAEITDCKKTIKSLEQQVGVLEREKTELMKAVTETREQVREMDRYKRRWNLRLKGLKEQEDEDTRGITLNLLQKIAPHLSAKLDDAVDTVHRVGRREQGRVRQVIIQFSMRTCRDQIWKLSKNSAVCSEDHLRFTEDLSQADKLAREAVWPKIQEARAAGLRAYYRGCVGYINGKRVPPPV